MHVCHPATELDGTVVAQWENLFALICLWLQNGGVYIKLKIIWKRCSDKCLKARDVCVRVANKKCKRQNWHTHTQSRQLVRHIIYLAYAHLTVYHLRLKTGVFLFAVQKNICAPTATVRKTKLITLYLWYHQTSVKNCNLLPAVLFITLVSLLLTFASKVPLNYSKPSTPTCHLTCVETGNQTRFSMQAADTLWC